MSNPLPTLERLTKGTVVAGTYCGEPFTGTIVDRNVCYWGSETYTVAPENFSLFGSLRETILVTVEVGSGIGREPGDSITHAAV